MRNSPPAIINDQKDSRSPHANSPLVKTRTVVPKESAISSDMPPALTSQLPPAPVPRTVTLERGDDGLGFSIVGGFGSNLGDLPIYVKSVFEKGSASREGTLARGDQILEVNGMSLKSLTHASAVGVLKEAKGTVRLLILPAK